MGVEGEGDLMTPGKMEEEENRFLKRKETTTTA